MVADTPIGPANYGCAVCGNVFGTLTSFDAHQVRRYGQEPPITCKKPEELGLIQDPQGRWRTPQGEANRARLATRLATARSHPGAALEGDWHGPLPELPSRWSDGDEPATVRGLLGLPDTST